MEVQAQVRLARQQDEASCTRSQLQGALADAQAAHRAQEALVQVSLPVLRLTDQSHMLHHSHVLHSILQGLCSTHILVPYAALKCRSPKQ